MTDQNHPQNHPQNLSQNQHDDHRQDHLIGREGAVDPDQGETDFDDAVIAFLCRHARGRRVLDLGCVNHNPENARSRHWVHKALVAVADTVVGLDLYAEGVESLRAQGFDVRHGDASAFSLESRFDVIVAGELIEHLGHPAGLIACARRHLAPDGVLLLTTPNPWHWRLLIKAALAADVRPNREHVAWYCLATLGSLLAREGFAIVEFQRASRYLPDRLMPLPPGLRHTTLMFAARPVDRAAGPQGSQAEGDGRVPAIGNAGPP